MIISPVHGISRSVNKNRSLNVLVYAFDGCFEYHLAKSCPKHTFFCLKNAVKINWNTSIWSVNNNLYTCTELPQHVVFDCIICNDISHYQSAKPLANMLHIPLIFIEHAVTKHPEIQEKYHYVTHESINPNLPVIYYGIMEMDAPSNKQGAVIISDFATYDIVLIHELVNKSKIPIRVFGNNNSISSPITSFIEYKDILEHALVYIHLTSDINLPPNPLYAMSAGCIIISGHTSILPHVIDNNKGYVTNGIAEAITLINDIDLYPEKYKPIAMSARQHIIDNFSLDTFAKKWNNIFDTITREAFIQHENKN